MKNVIKIFVSIGIVVSSSAWGDSNLTVPTSAPKAYPDGPLGEMVKLGEDIANKTNTHPLTKDMIGNKLTCANCHLPGSDGKPGTQAGISTWIGTATVFPAYSGREKIIQTLQDRSNNCFMRSMNGERLSVDSKASLALLAYITWLSDGMPMHMSTKRPVAPQLNEWWSKEQKKYKAIQEKATHANYEHGKKLFVQKCAACHGTDGAGGATFPPLWGKGKDCKWLSYNAGAGMSKLNKAPAWVQAHMPFGQGNTLKDQEAADIVLFVDAQPRANFSLKRGLENNKGIYNSDVHEEKDSVRSNFKALGLDIDTIRGDTLIP